MSRRLASCASAISPSIRSKSSTATVAQYPNLAFSLAKLVPGASGSPSKWVSYIVTTVPSTTTAAAPTRPSTDNTGTLVDNGDGSYKYTFYRDITKIQADVAAMTGRKARPVQPVRLARQARPVLRGRTRSF